MPIHFTDISSDISFELVDSLKRTERTLVVKNEIRKVSLPIGLLQLYGLYRNTVYDSYKTKKELAEDIRTKAKVYTEAATSKANQDHYYHDPVYHYSVLASQDTMKEWTDTKGQNNGQMKMYIAYQTINNKRVKIGFVHFIEKTMNNKQVVYIAQAGVTTRGKSIGRALMECVMAHYPANTEFYILTRVFNTEAKILYQDRLKFTPIEQAEVQALDYDIRYCGFKHTTTAEEIALIKSKIQTNLSIKSKNPVVVVTSSAGTATVPTLSAANLAAGAANVKFNK